MSYITELSSFPVKYGKEARADEWMAILVERQSECVETLDREAMHFETIFKSSIDNRIYLTWFSLEGETGEHVNTSSFPIDKIHMEFWNECIDATVPPIKFQHIVNFLPKLVADSIETRDALLAKNENSALNL